MHATKYLLTNHFSNLILGDSFLVADHCSLCESKQKKEQAANGMDLNAFKFIGNANLGKFKMRYICLEFNMFFFSFKKLQTIIN